MPEGLIYSPDTHAAVLHWRMYGVGSNAQIYLVRDTYTLFQQMKDSLLSYANLLIDDHWEEIACSDLECLFEQFSEGDRTPPEDFGTSNVRDLLAGFLNLRSRQLKHHPQDRSIHGEWFQLLEWLNDIWGPEDFIQIPFEGRIPLFLRWMPAYLDSLTLSPKLAQIQEGQWIKTLKDIIVSDRWRTREGFSRLTALVDEFNDRYGFS